MGVFVVDSCIVKSEKIEEFSLYIEKYNKLMKDRPELFKETKSFKIFNQVFGEQVGLHYTTMMEFENLEEMAKAATRYFTEPELVEIDHDFILLIEPASYSRRVWVSLE